MTDCLVSDIWVCPWLVSAASLRGSPQTGLRAAALKSAAHGSPVTSTRRKPTRRPRKLSGALLGVSSAFIRESRGPACALDPQADLITGRGDPSLPRGSQPAPGRLASRPQRRATLI